MYTLVNSAFCNHPVPSQCPPNYTFELQSTQSGTDYVID